MKRSTTIFLLGLLVLCATLVAAPSWAQMKPGKPQLPVRFTIEQTHAGAATGGKIRPGEAAEIAVSATAMTAISEMRIEVSLHGGAEYVSGALEWNGPAKQRETKKLILTVRAPEKGTGKVRATVTFYRDGKQVLKRSAQYALGADEEGKSKKPAYELKKDSKGRDIIEY